MLNLLSTWPSKAPAADNLLFRAAKIPPIIVTVIVKKEKTVISFLTIPPEEEGEGDGV